MFLTLIVFSAKSENVIYTGHYWQKGGGGGKLKDTRVHATE